MFEQFLLENKHIPIINPYNCGYQHCPPGHSPGYLVRDYWLMHYVVSGKGRFVERGTVHEVTAGQCFIIRPMEITSYYADENDPWYYIWIGFETTLDLPACFDEAVIDGSDIKSIFLSLAEIDKNRSHCEEHIAGKIFEMISLLSAKGEPRSKENSIAAMAKNIIDTSYATVNVSEVAKMMHLSRAYLGTVFKRSEGVTLQQYLQSCRLRKAATFMKEMNMSPGQAGSAVGFNDVYSFSRAFKRYFRITPSEFKKRTEDNLSVFVKQK